MTEPTFSPTIRTQAALEEAWRHLSSPWILDGHSVWVMVIEDDHPLPQLVEMAECPEAPSEAAHDGFGHVLRMLGGDGGGDVRFAFALSRPGPDVVTDPDRRWASWLYAASRAAGVQCEVVHLVTPGAVRPVPADEVGGMARSA